MSTTIETLSCGHPPTPNSGAGTGYATLPDDRKVCYGCADSATAAEVAAAKPGDRITLYVSGDGKSITTWSGGTMMNRVVFGKRHNFSEDRHFITAVDVDGRTWSGTGAAGMWANLRLTKQ